MFGNKVFYTVIIFLTFSCASQDISLDCRAEFKFEKPYIWVDLMPGSNPLFHIKWKVNRKGGSNFNECGIEKIRIMQNGSELFSFVPRIQYFGTAAEITQPGNGLKLNPNLDIDKPVDAEMQFNTKIKNIKIKGIKVIKTY